MVAFEAEHDVSRRRVLLEACIKLGEVGSEGQFWPKWVKRIGNQLTCLEDAEITEELRRRAKKEKQRPDKLDRDVR